MKSKIEVELRAKITPNIIKKIKSELLKESKEHDSYFRHKADVEKTWIARIRIKNNKYLLTYKSNKQFGEGAWDEVNIPITKEIATQLRDFFTSNEHDLEVEIKKYRQSFNIDGMEINVDNIGKLGTYIEAEILTDSDHIEEAKAKIRLLFKNLGISDKNITNKGYVGLMRGKNGITS